MKENTPLYYGKVVFVNTDDSDAKADAKLLGKPGKPGIFVNGGIPDWADGFNRYDNIKADDRSAKDEFTPMILEIPEPIDLSKAKIRFTYSDSDPAQKLIKSGTGATAQDPIVYKSPSDLTGSFRIWLKNASEARNYHSVLAKKPGDYVPSHAGEKLAEYTDLSKLGFSEKKRAIPLYLEAIKPLGYHTPETIKVELDPDGDGPAEYISMDIVKASIPKVDLKWEEMTDATGKVISPLTPNDHPDAPQGAKGLKIFPGKTSPKDTIRNVVRLRARVTPALKGLKVFFKVFDVDDPSDSTVIDPNGDEGDDNFGSPKTGGLYAEDNGLTDNKGDATAVFATTMQPGDNFRAVATVINDTTGDYDNAKVLAMDPKNEPVTQTLTVWRRIYYELDRMKRPRFLENCCWSSFGIILNAGKYDWTIAFLASKVQGYFDFFDVERFKEGYVLISTDTEKVFGLILESYKRGSYFYLHVRIPFHTAISKDFFSKPHTYAWGDDDISDQLDKIWPTPSKLTRNILIKRSFGDVGYTLPKRFFNVAPFKKAYIVFQHNEEWDDRLKFIPNATGRLYSAFSNIFQEALKHKSSKNEMNFWALQLCVGFQPRVYSGWFNEYNEDADPDDGEGILYGLTQSYYDNIVYYFKETVRERVVKSNDGLETRYFPHELGHACDLPHYKLGNYLMNPKPTENGGDEFSEYSINKLRNMLKPHSTEEE